ncbi:MAG: GTPase HflX [Clostridia bacterium]|nr:GTPase HflX [Clostridia bacterium]
MTKPIGDPVADARAVLLGLITRGSDERDCEVSLQELERLLSTAGGTVAARCLQAREAPDARTGIGSGKVREVADLCKAEGLSLAVFDGELSPSQIRNLEDAIDPDGSVRVIDRSMLILDIFAAHAKTAEGKLQVELAQLQYSVPRLTGHGTELSRLGGGIGTRGPGESQLERDRRHVRRRIAALEEELSRLEQIRLTQRKQRERSGMPLVAIAGYTNAGKSTLLNALTDAGILAEDKLFATLDPTTRHYTLPDTTEILLTDTVGFIRNLPHHLISAFRSTLDEIRYADCVILVMDASDPECRAQAEVSRSLLEELGAGDKPVLYVFNKSDLCTDPVRDPLPESGIRAVSLSALTGEGMERFLGALTDLIRAGSRVDTFRFPLSEQKALSGFYREATVLSADYGEEAAVLRARTDAKVRGRYAAFLSEEQDHAG